MKSLFALISSIAILDKWAERVFQEYAKWRAEQRQAEIKESVLNAHKAGSVEEIRKRIRHDL